MEGSKGEAEDLKVKRKEGKNVSFGEKNKCRKESFTLSCISGKEGEKKGR